MRRGHRIDPEYLVDQEDDAGADKGVNPAVLVLAALIGAGSAMAYLNPELHSLITGKITEIGLMPGCGIKGNIASGSDEKVYLVPGQQDYWITSIRRDAGERWFCTEEEAVAAGWRRSAN